jgi:RNA polymerase sigma-70 factor (ECF subfamily)
MIRAMREAGALIRAARAGDEEALDALLESYRGLLRLLARPVLDRFPAADADASDVAQETLVKAHRRFPQFRGGSEGEFVSWLKAILARNLGDARRRVAGRGARPLPRTRSLEAMVDRSSFALSRLLPASGTSPSQRAMTVERGRALAAALDRLPPDHREVITLRSLRELPWDEVGLRMQRTPDAARVLWARALRGLGRQFGGAS